jgi:uncharacterized membrane protein (UPF0127 family)
MPSGILQWLKSLGNPPQQRQPELLRITNPARQTAIGDRIQVADRGELRRKGLLGRTALGPGDGLWIVPCEAVHMFGMKFALDVIFLDRKRRVVKVRRNLRPGRLSGSLRAHSVLELPVGTIDATSTQPGDQLAFDRTTTC